VKIAIVGVGERYKSNICIIKKYFDIVGIFCENVTGSIVIDGLVVRNTKEICNFEFEKALICSDKYFDEIFAELVKLNVCPNIIVGLEFLSPYWRLEDDERYQRTLVEYDNLCNEQNYYRFPITDIEPHKDDYRSNAGSIDSHYFLQDILMAKIIINTTPKIHYDIGSRIDGLISHLIVGGISVHEIDIRELKSIEIGYGIPRLQFEQADATGLLSIEDDSIDSLSSCHAVEHFGLGRYGDEIDPTAWEKGLMAMQRVMKTNGKLFLSVPIGKEEKLVFNSCRIFYPKTIVETLDKMTLQEMYIIHDFKVYQYSWSDFEMEKYKDIIGEYDCGLFIFTK